MKKAIIIYTGDDASVNIKENLLDIYKFEKTDERYDKNPVYKYDKDIFLYTTSEEHINANDLDKNIDADIFIFASKHSSGSGKKTLSVHTPGNFGNAELGGVSKKLCISPAKLIKKAFLEMKRLNTLNEFEVTLECTHHGPFIEKPCVFIEIGSRKEEWNNIEAGKIIAEVIINILMKLEKENDDEKIAFGIGGPHYCNNFNKIIEKTNISVGHICPKYVLENLDEDMIKQTIEKHDKKVDFAILDWKGISGSEKTRIIKILDKLKIKYLRSDKL